MTGNAALPIVTHDANVIELPNSATTTISTSRFRLPREGILWLLTAGLMFVTGLFKGINLLILLAYVMMGMWCLNWYFVRNDLRRLRGHWRRSEAIVAGVPTEFQIELKVTGSRPVLAVSIEGLGRRWFVLKAGGREPVRIRCQHIFPTRGLHSSGMLWAGSQFPFGLASRAINLAGAESCMVLPRIGSLDADQLKHWLTKATRGDGRSRRQLQPAMHEGDIHGLRDFRPGDSPRWIHWRSSARRNQTLVREFEDGTPSDIILVIEPWLPEGESRDDRARLETAIEMAATICRNWCRDLSARMSVIVSSPEPAFVPAGNGAEYSLHVLELLAMLKGQPAVAATTWIEKAPRMRSSIPVLVLTSSAHSTLAGEIGAIIGRPVAQVAVGDAPPWYAAPYRDRPNGQAERAN